MHINHLIVGSENVSKSVQFYCDFLGFRKTQDDPGAVGGQVLEHDQSELLILPFPKDRLPNPAHFAFEVYELIQFENLLAKAVSLKLSPRSQPARNSSPGPTEFFRGQHRYKIFYVYDPSGVNLEVMVKLSDSIK